MQKKSTGRKLLVLTVCAVVLAAVFYLVVRDDWNRAEVVTTPITAAGLIPAEEDGQNVIEQKVQMEADQLQLIRLLPGRTRAQVSGQVAISFLDEGGSLLKEFSVDAGSLVFDEMNEFVVAPALEGQRGKTVTLRIDTGDTGVSFQYGKTTSAGKYEIAAQGTDQLTVRGEPFEGRLVMGFTGLQTLNQGWLALVLAGLVFLACAAWVLLGADARKKGKNNLFFRLDEIREHYTYLLKTLVNRDFRIKYQASVLGMLWSFLNPLLTMLVYLFVFSTLFRSNIEHFPVYLMTGIVLFNYFSDSTTLGLASIVVNRTLITKVYMPKMLYPLAKVLSSAINLMISFIPLAIVMLLSGVAFHKSLLLLPFVVIFIVLFCLGMSLILSTLDVFFRDIQFLWGVLITILNFLTPIFYPETIIPEAFRTIYHMNPLYQVMHFMRCITLDGVAPSPLSFLYCFLAGMIPLAIGVLVFRKNQDRFVLYL